MEEIKESRIKMTVTDFTNWSKSPLGVQSSTPKTQNQVPKDKRLNPADPIKPTTSISHSAAFFHFSTKNTPPKKPELALLSCGGPGMTGAALISARHTRYTSAFPFPPEPVLSVPAPERKEQKKKKEKKKREAKSAK